MIVSLHVPDSVGATYVAALRRLVPELPPIPSGILLAKLRKSGLVVLGRFSEARAGEIIARGRAEGLTFTARQRTLFDRALVLEALGAPPLEVCERPVIEALSDRRILGAVGAALAQLRLSEEDAFVDEAHLVPAPFHCCGDEDLLPFRCRGCERLMVLCHECDTLYPDLHDLALRTEWPGPCLACGASTAGAHEVTHRSRRPAWKEAELEHLLRVDPRA